MRKYLIGLVILLSALNLHAQDPHFSQFFSSPLTLNPAFTGKFDGQWRLAVNHRDQWPSIPKAYVTTSGSLDFGIMKNKLPEGDVFGIGISGLSDASANSQLKLNYGSLSLSYHKALDEDGYNTIGAGFQGTYSSLVLEEGKLTFEDMLRQNGFTGARTDFFTNGNSQNYVDLNAGVLFSGSSNGSNNYYVGVSAYHINKPSVGFKDASYQLASRITVHGGGTLPVSDVLTFNGSVIYQIQSKSNETTLGGALAYGLNGAEAERPSSIYAGAWYRLNDAIIPYLGLEVGGLRIGASYDVNISSLKTATASRGGSEFSIIYIKQKTESKGIPCPKF
jgi:type IX secretion system PorP/SprF family membrane protein